MATLSLTCVNLPLVLVYKKTSFHSEVFKFEVILGLAIENKFHNFCTKMFSTILSWQHFLRLDWHIFINRDSQKYYHNCLT